MATLNINLRLHLTTLVDLCFVITESRSEEHTSELQSQSNLVCRLLLEKKKFSYGSLTNRLYHNRSSSPQIAGDAESAFRYLPPRKRPASTTRRPTPEHIAQRVSAPRFD